MMKLQIIKENESQVSYIDFSNAAKMGYEVKKFDGKWKTIYSENKRFYGTAIGKNMIVFQKGDTSKYAIVEWHNKVTLKRFSKWMNSKKINAIKKGVIILKH